MTGKDVKLSRDLATQFMRNARDKGASMPVGMHAAMDVIALIVAAENISIEPICDLLRSVHRRYARSITVVKQPESTESESESNDNEDFLRSLLKKDKPE